MVVAVKVFREKFGFLNAEVFFEAVSESVAMLRAGSGLALLALRRQRGNIQKTSPSRKAPP